MLNTILSAMFVYPGNESIRMRLPSQFSQRSALRFNITPLIDVVFLLIIFFLVASHFVRNEQAEPVDLPVSRQGLSDEHPATNRLTITIDKPGQLFVAGEPQTNQTVVREIEHLEARAEANGAEPEVRIRSDRATSYRHVRTLLEHCAGLGIRSIRFAVTIENPAG